MTLLSLQCPILGLSEGQSRVWGGVWTNTANQTGKGEWQGGVSEGPWG